MVLVATPMVAPLDKRPVSVATVLGAAVGFATTGAAVAVAGVATVSSTSSSSLSLMMSKYFLKKRGSMINTLTLLHHLDHQWEIPHNHQLRRCMDYLCSMPQG